jgi:hypothetical protein
MFVDDQSNRVTPISGNTAVYDSARRFALTGLSDLIRVLMENMDDALFELSEKVENDRERNMYFEAMREIRLKRDVMQERFDREMINCFSRLSDNDTDASLSSDDDDSELTLMELDEVEDNLAIDNMISKARPHFEDDLFAVTERLKIVLRQNTIDEDDNPLDPKAICESFHNAADVIDSNIQVKLIFYKLFDKYVMRNLGHFYGELNHFFIDKGVLPEFKASAERMKQTTRFMSNRIRSSEQGAEANSADEPLPSNSIDDITSTPPTEQDGLLAMLQEIIKPSAALQTGANLGNGPGYTQDNMLPNTPSTALSLAPGAPMAGNNLAVGGQVGFTPITQNAGYMSALANLQVPAIQGQPVESIDPQQARVAMQQQLVAFNQENSQKASAAENHIIDIVSMLFDFFFDDESLPSSIKVLIGRLQIPILKAAIIDDSFFNHKKHPARKLLDSISKAALGWSKDQTQEKVLIEKIEQVVNQLLTDFEQDVSVFNDALADFELFLHDENGRIKQEDERLRQQEKDKERQVRDAQNSAIRLVQKLTLNRELSFEVTEFLDNTWTSVLSNIYLTMGEKSNHWKNIRRISSTFIWSLIPKFSEQERLKIIKTLPALLRAMSQGMTLVKINSDIQNDVFQMLARQHSKIVKQTSKNIVTRVDDQTIWPGENAESAFSSYTQSLANEEIDIEFSTDDTGEIDIVDKVDDPDAINIITASPTSDVIKNMEDFTAGAKQGEIELDEEIIIESLEQAAFHAQPEIESDDFLEQAQNLEIGAWVAFAEVDGSAINARLTWKSNVTGKIVFSNRQGHKIKNMTTYGFATELRSGRAKPVQSASVFDRAISTIMTSLKH